MEAALKCGHWGHLLTEHQCSMTSDVDNYVGNAQTNIRRISAVPTSYWKPVCFLMSFYLTVDLSLLSHLTMRHLCSAILGTAAFELLTVAELHNRSAIAEARGLE